MKWTTLSTAVTVLAQLVQLVVLARILSPQDFGLMAMITVVTGFSRAYADLGLSSAIVQREQTTPAQLSSLYWANLAAGLCLFLVLLAATPAVAAFYREPRLHELLPWAASTFILAAAGQQYIALLQRELRFSHIARVEIIASIAGLVAAITSALLGAGVYAIIIGQLTYSGMRSGGAVIAGLSIWRPTAHFARADLRGYLAFGLFQSSERGARFLAGNVDYLLIGRFLGPEVLGIYTIAYQLVMLPVQRLNPIFTDVAFPILSRRQRDIAALRSGFLRMAEVLGFVVFPLLGGLAAVAPVLVPVVFGPEWIAAVPLVQILAIVGLVRVLSNPVSTVFYAMGRARLAFTLTTANALVNAIVFTLVVQYGVQALAWSFAATSVVYLVFERAVLNRVIALRLGEYLRVLQRPLLITAAMMVAVFGTQAWLRPAIDVDPLTLAFSIALGAVTYCAAWLLVDPAYCRSLLGMIRPRSGAKAAL